MLKRLEKVLKEYADVNIELSEETSLKKDLGMNSLELVEMVVAVEDEFGVEISDREIQGIETVGDVMKMLEKKL